LIHQKDLTKIFKNAYNLFVNDIQDIFSNIQSFIQTLTNPNNIKAKEIISDKNEKHFLILFSANSELFILDAITGEKKFERKFPNFSLLNIKIPNNMNSFNFENKRHYYEIDNNVHNAVVNLELKHIDNKSEELLFIQINLKDFTYQEIDINLKNYFSMESLANSINKNLNESKNFNEVIEVSIPIPTNDLAEEDSLHKRKFNLNEKIILNFNQNQNTLYGMKMNIKENNKVNMKPLWNFNLNNHKLINYQLAKVPENIHTV